MYQRLKTYREVPPKGFRYTVPETGQYITAWNVENWLDKIKAHLTANNIPIPIDLLAQAEDQLCQLLPPGFCEYEDPSRPKIDTNFGWGDVEQGSKTLFEWATQGLPLVSQDEAERRAKICANCYANIRVTGCGVSCRELIRNIVGWFVKRKTSSDESLNSCGVCHCFLKSKVHVPLEVIEKYDNPSLQPMYPKWCWLRKDSDNYKP